MAMTYSQAIKLLNSNFGKNPELTSDSTYYIGLSSTNPGNEGNSVTEPTVGSYARVEVQNSSAFWNTATIYGVTTNSQNIVFPTSSASWGTVSYVFVANSPSLTGTAILYYEAISEITVEINTTIQFLAGTFSISMINT